MDMTLRIAELHPVANDARHEVLCIAMYAAVATSSLDVAETYLRETLSANDWFIYRGGSHISVHERTATGITDDRSALLAEERVVESISIENFPALKQAVAEARQEAEREAKGYGYRIVRSRGTFLSTLSKGEQAWPYPAAEAGTWDGTKKDIAAAIARVQADYPEVDQIVIEGGFNGGNTFDDFANGDYQPWASAWSVTVWTR